MVFTNLLADNGEPAGGDLKARGLGAGWGTEKVAERTVLCTCTNTPQRTDAVYAMYTYYCHGKNGTVFLRGLEVKEL